LRSKWAAGKARGGRISKLIRNRGATQPPAHFHRNPLGRGQLAVFPRCSLLTYRFRYARRSRLEKQPTDRRRKSCLFRGQDTRLTYPRVMPALVGSDLRADRERASRTSQTGSPRRCNHRRNGIGTKGRKDHQEMMVIDQPPTTRRKMGRHNGGRPSLWIGLRLTDLKAVKGKRIGSPRLSGRRIA